MKYFAYGSNMSIQRLRARVSGAQLIAQATLAEHSLRFHLDHAEGLGFGYNAKQEYAIHGPQA